MKLIFLDIDGVLTSTKDIIKNKFEYTFNNESLKVLKNIVDESDAKIVITSYRRNHTNSKISLGMIEKFKENDICIYDQTPNINYFNRGKEIYTYLMGKKDIESWVVIDNNIFRDFHEYDIPNHFIKTNMFYGGLSSGHIDQILSILNNTKDYIKEKNELLK